MEASKRKESDFELANGENCILCFNELKFFALGECDHKCVCNLCCLRLRLIMEDEQCPICKTELEEVVITSDRDLDWKFFKKKLAKNCDEDEEDESILYHTREAQEDSMKQRNLTCLILNCKSN
jgi:hypothetical protein